MAEYTKVVPLYYSVPLLFICVGILSLLIFVFNLGNSAIFLQPAPPVTVNVNACSTLPLNDTYYVLTGNINFLGAGCFVMTGYNSTLDGNSQYILSGDNTAGMSAVTVLGNGNVIRELNITNAHNGIALMGANNTLVTFNDVGNSLNLTVYIYSSVNNTVNRNILSFGSGRAGVHLKSSSLNNILQNKIYGPSSPALSSGVEIEGSLANNVSGNTINATLLSLALDSSSNNFFFGNRISWPYGSGIYLTSSPGPNKFVDNSVSNTLYRGFGSVNSYNTYLKNLTISGTGTVFYDLEAALPSNSFEIVDSTIRKYMINNSVITFYNSSNARINFTQNISETGNDLSADVRLGTNYVDVNSATKPGLNKPAIITLEGISTSLTNATIYRNGVTCPSNICTNLTSLNVGTVMFSVSGWTNYSIGNGVVGFPTLSIEEPDPSETYTLSNFPVNFIVDLSQNGSAWFSLNNGSTNVTMNTNNNRRFTYNQSSLSAGNYTLWAYANFTTSSLKDNRSVNFRVTIPIIPGGSNSTTNNTQNATPPYTPPQNNGTTIQLNNTSSGSGSGSSAGSSVEFKYVAYWLVVSIISVLIIILVFLIIKAMQSRHMGQNRPGSIVSQLR